MLYISCTGREPHFLTIMALQINVDYTSPWDKRYWAKDYAEMALAILNKSERWPAGSLKVVHFDPNSPTHWRLMPTNGIQQPGW